MEEAEEKYEGIEMNFEGAYLNGGVGLEQKVLHPEGVSTVQIV